MHSLPFQPSCLLFLSIYPARHSKCNANHQHSSFPHPQLFGITIDQCGDCAPLEEGFATAHSSPLLLCQHLCIIFCESAIKRMRKCKFSPRMEAQKRRKKLESWHILLDTSQHLSGQLVTLPFECVDHIMGWQHDVLQCQWSWNFASSVLLGWVRHQQRWHQPFKAIS